MAVKVPDFILQHDSFKASRGMSKESFDGQSAVLRRVGALMTIWSGVESTFVGILERMLDTSMENALIVFYSINNNRARMELISALVKENLSGTAQSKALKLVDRFKAPTKLRNELAHCEYATDPADMIIKGTFSTDIRRAGSGKSVGQFRQFDKARINEIDHATGELLKLSDEVWKFCQSLDEKKAPPPTPSA